MVNEMWLEKLEMLHPIVQAPMAGVTTPEFVAASAEAGILGSIGAGYLSAENTREFIRNVKKLTSKPFAVNLFVPEQPEMSQDQLRQAYEALQPIGQKLGIPFWKTPLSTSEFDEQLQVIVEEGVQACSFTFGLPDEKHVKWLKDNGVMLIGTATTVEEAELAERAGMDMIVAQGSEAGGHRGSFTAPMQLIPLDPLLAEIIAAVRIPVIAAGGIANKEFKDACLAMGAQAVQIGTVLLATEESGAHPLYKEAVLNVLPGNTSFTTAFSGKAARGIRNEFMEVMEDKIIAPYPYQNDLTKEIRKVAAQKGKSNYMSLWAGEQAHLSKKGTIQEIIETFI